MRKAARTDTRDEDLIDSAGKPDAVSSQQTLTLTTGQEIYVENMENSLLLDNQISKMEPVLPFRDNQTPTIELTSSHQQLAGDSGNYTDPWPLPTCSQPDFQWGQLDGQTFCEMIDTAYNDIIHWKHNIFLLPSGAAGKSFIQEITRLLQAFANGSPMESIALKTSFVMQILLLQKPSKKSKSKDHISHLKRRLELHNVSVLWPPLSPVLINTYRAPVRMIVAGSGEISCTEGTTQGDALGMAMYAPSLQCH